MSIQFEPGDIIVNDDSAVPEPPPPSPTTQTVHTLAKDHFVRMDDPAIHGALNAIGMTRLAQQLHPE